MAIPESSWTRAVELLSEAQEVALACHVDPDGDALGSMLALRHLLVSRGVHVVASYGAPESDGGRATPMVVPPQYTFLPGLSALVRPERFPRAPELFVAFDTATADRLGTLRSVVETAGHTIVLDHHASGSAFGDVQLVDGEAAATTVLVEQLIERLGGSLDRDIATCLYVGLVTDTASFRTPSTTPDVLSFGARLVAHGVDNDHVNRQVFATHSFGYLKALGRALDRAELRPEVGLVWTVVRQQDLSDLGITMAETEGLIDVLRTVAAAEVTLVCKEQRRDAGEPQRWRGSLRSAGDIDVSQLAYRLGGGGHRFMAGFLAEGDLADVVAGVASGIDDQQASSSNSPDATAASPVAGGTGGR